MPQGLVSALRWELPAPLQVGLLALLVPSLVLRSEEPLAALLADIWAERVVITLPILF